MINLILLDMDGVVADFVGAAAVRHNANPDVSTWNFPEVEWGITQEAFWDALSDFEFWANIGMFHWTMEFYQALKELAPVKFCSSPSRDPQCLAGKLAWLQDRWGKGFRDFIFTPDKTPLARDNVLLIDDGDHNVKAFIEAGGRAILFPQKWNRWGVSPYPDRWKGVLVKAEKICEKDLRYLEDIYHRDWN